MKVFYENFYAELYVVDLADATPRRYSRPLRPHAASTMDGAEIESIHIRLLMARVDASMRAGLIPPDTRQRLDAALAAENAGRPGATASAAQVRRILRELLAELDVTPLHDAFRSQYVAGFETVRVLTGDAFQAHYADPPTSRGASGSARTAPQRDADQRPAPAAATAAPAWTLKPTILLCRAGASAFVGASADWHHQTEGAANRADETADWLALPMTEGTGLVALVMGASVEIGWSRCRRPTVADALEHTWWWCFADDPQHHGHTIMVSPLSAQSLIRGAKEWIVGAIDIDTRSGQVRYDELPALSIDTTLAGRPEAGRSFAKAAEREART